MNGDWIMDLTGKKVWFLGDSITEGVGTSCAEARFSEVLKKNANLGEIMEFQRLVLRDSKD